LHFIAHLSLAVFCIELIHAVQGAITVIHDATSDALAILKGVVCPKVVANLMSESQPV